MGILADMLSFSFICRALVVGIFVALCAALLGVSMVLKRYAMIGDGHTFLLVRCLLRWHLDLHR